MRFILSVLVLLLSSQASAQSVVSNAQIANAVLGLPPVGGPFTYVATATNSGDGALGTIATSSTLNVASGDLLIAIVTYEDATVTVSANDSGSNTFTFDTGDDVHYTANNVNIWVGYKINATANATATITATFTGGSPAFRRLIVFQYRPYAGETVTKDRSGSPNATGNNGSIATGTFSTTGTDNVVCGAAANYATGTWSAWQIGGVNADQTAVIPAPGTATGWCRIVSAALTNVTATASNTQSREWVATAISFKSQ